MRFHARLAVGIQSVSNRILPVLLLLLALAIQIQRTSAFSPSSFQSPQQHSFSTKTSTLPFRTTASPIRRTPSSTSAYTIRQSSTRLCFQKQSHNNVAVSSILSSLSPPRRTSSLRLAASSSNSNNSKEEDLIVVSAQDLEALQALFNQYCDSEGLMTREQVRNVPAIADLLEEGDLLPEEFDQIWKKAPKFPDESQRLDVDSFVQVYRDIDDIFEDDDDDDGEEEKVDKQAVPKSPPKTTGSTTGPATASSGVKSEAADEDDDDEEESELVQVFQTLCDDAQLISKSTLKVWDEVSTLLEDGMLGEDEFDSLWDKTPKSPGSSNQQLDVEGFLSFNIALDSLFEFEDDEMMEDPDNDPPAAIPPPAAPTPTTANLPMIEGDGLEPEALFEILATPDGLVGKSEINRWQELREMLAEGEILPKELQDIFGAIPKADKDGPKIDKEGFLQFYKAVDDLFEEVDDDDTDTPKDGAASSGSAAERKRDLLTVLDELNGDPEILPCGLECTEPEQRAIRGLVEEIESSPENVVRKKKGELELTDLVGTWELLYSSSSAMSYNQGLSGLGGSVPNGKFGGVIQKLSVSKVTSDVEYLERIDVVPSSASFDVRVTGDWGLSTSVSLFTGEPSTVLTVVPDRVTYGPTTTRADHWKSLGPLNMLDVTYLDDNVRIMRGNTSTETIFVFRKVD